MHNEIRIKTKQTINSEREKHLGVCLLWCSRLRLVLEPERDKVGLYSLLITSGPRPRTPNLVVDSGPSRQKPGRICCPPTHPPSLVCFMSSKMNSPVLHDRNTSYSLGTFFSSTFFLPIKNNTLQNFFKLTLLPNLNFYHLRFC